MKVVKSITAIITCENEYEIRLIRECLQAGITHTKFDPKELKYIEDLERQLLT